MSTRTDSISPPERLLTPARLPFVIATVALVSLGAYENRATMTVLPVVAKDLDGMALFGAAGAVPSATFLIGAAMAGIMTDRRGPTVPLLLGLVGFVIAAVGQALAPSMGWLLGARAVSGAAEAMLDVSITVLIARVIPHDLRPRMFSMIATAWIVPSLVGPGLAGLIEQQFGWRAVFLVGAIAAVPVAPALIPALRQIAGEMPAGQSEHRAVATMLRASVIAGVGIAAVSLAGPEFGNGSMHAILGGALLVGGLAAMIMPTRTLLPDGVMRVRCGAAAVIAVRGLVAGAFGLLGAFLPLMLQSTRGLSPAASGVTLSITGLFWAVGSNISSRPWVQERSSALQRIRIGLSLIGLGGLGVLAYVAGHGTYGFVLATWALSGVGMGLTVNSLTTALLDLAPVASLGFHQSAASTVSVAAQGLAAAGGGAAIALASSTSTVFVAITATGVLIALAAYLVAPRMAIDCATS